ncbi:ThiF family adenylyltransferase [Citricoccus nitrophenolicus]|uniref:ThiF family adenylyltransferase n=1 Tax=Citricoccus nitrophenolicus TaxID=863575 RepID=UPI0031F06CBB
MRLDPGLTVLKISEDTVQIGSGSRSTQLSGCSPAALEYLSLLIPGIPDGHEPDAARRCELDPAAARTLESTLAPFLRRHESTWPTGAGHASDVLAEDLALSLALDSGPASAPGASPARATDSAERTAQVFASRRDLQVQVLGLGRTGAVVARVLAASGVGRLALWGDGEVTVADLGTGFLPPDLGRNRSIALSRRLDDAGLDTVVLPLTSPTRPRPGGTLTVSVTRGVADEDYIALARSADHPVLPVVMRDDDALIGPWLMPGLGGCPLCWELSARQADPLRLPRSAALARQGAGCEDVGLATAAGALAARQAVRWAETGTVYAGSVLQVHGDGSRVESLAVATHPDCGCGPVEVAA